MMTVVKKGKSKTRRGDVFENETSTTTQLPSNTYVSLALSFREGHATFFPNSFCDGHGLVNSNLNGPRAHVFWYMQVQT